MTGGKKAGEKFNLGVIGGSFDPVHIGHLAIAEEARGQFALDKVVFVPAAQPPHKGTGTAAPAADRLEMVRLAVAGNPHFLASDIEMRREGPSYTIDTLDEIQRIYPRARVYFIVGADSLGELRTWHRAKELVERFDFIVLARPGVRRPGMAELAADFGEKIAARLDGNFLSAGIFDLSATEIRRRVREGRGIRYLVPGAVERYILTRGLYAEKVP